MRFCLALALCVVLCGSAAACDRPRDAAVGMRTNSTGMLETGAPFRAARRRHRSGAWRDRRSKGHGGAPSAADTFLKLVYGRVVEFDAVDSVKHMASGLLAPYMRLCANDPGCDGRLAYALEARIDELLLQHWWLAEVGMVLDRLRVLGRQWDETHRRSRHMASPRGLVKQG